MNAFFRAVVCSAIIFCGPAFAAETAQNKEDLTGFVDIFDGKTLNGWHKLTSYNNNGQWEVIDGAIAGDQWPEGEGGLLVTEKAYSSYEIYAEVKTTWPQDSGLFLRVQPNVLSYQITIDHRPEGEVGAVYIPLGGGFAQHCYTGFSYWDPFDYNRMRVRIEGQPPRIQIWANGKLLNDYQGVLVDGKEVVPESGVIGIQVHPGENWRKGSKVLFRKIMVKEIK
ncbi:MAG: hypothetical protein A3F83_14290 [Candidatus Glassbacteria bacterium RIFCSPLOWO2_12_FULL_58_11]|uniref:3-keto-alpha-glucoside-1,2-lyase/3-keto-2-hydroxy-glucal hydratase domain-containing protein n=1 Tax=Candidatus Glassbacteria bacterium RIFCSPLOWO2_12_FULL_58_11 TaxID=1817867 RepID=A0A1F5YYH8_9BACT|nr:MAG: hypothetical protein A3F83_14290 [Candidatus Glassbacteria bacterium RIFCSPLOWO2_12_FULL_58_11]